MPACALSGRRMTRILPPPASSACCLRFAEVYRLPAIFDVKHLLEAAATISHALPPGALKAERNGGNAARAFAWFTGNNDLAMPLVDVETGSCRDGLHRDRPNENRGGESVLSRHSLGLAEIRRMFLVSEERPESPVAQTRGARSDLAWCRYRSVSLIGVGYRRHLLSPARSVCRDPGGRDTRRLRPLIVSSPPDAFTEISTRHLLVSTTHRALLPTILTRSAVGESDRG